MRGGFGSDYDVIFGFGRGSGRTIGEGGGSAYAASDAVVGNVSVVIVARIDVAESSSVADDRALRMKDFFGLVVSVVGLNGDDQIPEYIVVPVIIEVMAVPKLAPDLSVSKSKLVCGK